MEQTSTGIHLLTPRLVLRDHHWGDLPTHHALLSDARAMYYLPDIRTGTVEESEQNLRVAMGEIGKAERTYVFLRVEESVTGDHVGEIGYTVGSRCPLGAFVDVGYFLRPHHWGKGYAAEALRGVLRYAFDEGGVLRVACGCVAENRASERVMQKAGLLWEYERKQAVWHEDRLLDRVGYRLLRQEWLAAQGQP